jgi:hypothetical protein
MHRRAHESKLKTVGNGSSACEKKEKTTVSCVSSIVLSPENSGSERKLARKSRPFQSGLLYYSVVIKL